MPQVLGNLRCSKRGTRKVASHFKLTDPEAMTGGDWDANPERVE